jgi:hypothetical protein
MSSYRIAVNKTHREFNLQIVWNHHIVYLHGNTILPFCGTKAELMQVDDAKGYIEDIKNGKDLNSDEENPFCKSCIASVLAPGSDLEKDKKRVNRHIKREEVKFKNKIELARLKELKSAIINKFLPNCLDCNKPLKTETPGFLTYHFCENCDVKWIYFIQCDLDGSFKVSIYKNEFESILQKAIGNILWKEPFIKFSNGNPLDILVKEKAFA